MKKILLLLFFTTLNSAYSQESEWKRMYPLNVGDYWVYELFGPSDNLVSTETKRVLRDSIEKSNKLYKTLNRASYDFSGVFSYLENVRIDSFGIIYSKTKWDSVEKFYLPLDVTKGDTIPDPDDPFNDFWIVSDIWYSNEKRNVIYEKRGLVYTSIWMKEDIGNFDESYEGGGSLVLKGSYVNGVLTGDTTIVASIDQSNSSVPKSIKLFQNYPNPFNPRTTVEYFIPYSTKITISIYNLLGKRIRTLISNKLQVGSLKIIWDGRNNYGDFAGSGIYFYVLEYGSNRISKKMVLVR